MNILTAIVAGDPNDICFCLARFLQLVLFKKQNTLQWGNLWGIFYFLLSDTEGGAGRISFPTFLPRPQGESLE
jgi:hypothetical protein